MKLCTRCHQPFEGDEDDEYDKFDLAITCFDCAWKALTKFCGAKPKEAK